MTHGRSRGLARTVGGRYLTFLSLAALVLGFGLGIVLHGSRATWVPPLADALNVVGTVWIQVLQFTVAPLVVTQAFAAVMRTERLGTLGGKTLALFVVMLTSGALFTLLVSPPLLALYTVDAATVTALRNAITVPETVRDALGSETDLGDWLWGFIPTNAGRLFRGANFLLVLVSVIVLALLVKRFAGGRREAIQRRANRVADVALQLVGWILLAAPLGVLALTFGFALSAGGSAVGLMTYYIVVVSGLMVVFTALLYPLTALVAGIPLRRFAQAVAPAQLVAVSTRSSLASLPALIEGGKDRGLPVAATGFVLPLAVSTFKQSMAITHPFMLLFIAHMFGMQLGRPEHPRLRGDDFPHQLRHARHSRRESGCEDASRVRRGRRTGRRCADTRFARHDSRHLQDGHQRDRRHERGGHRDAGSGFCRLAARGESQPAFDRRCIPRDGVAPPSHTPGMLGRRALPRGRLAGLGATADFHHGLLGMIYCVVPRGQEFGIENYVNRWGERLRSRITTLNYEDLPQKDLPAGAYVFMGLDQLTPAGTAFVTRLQTRLRESPYAGPVLNDTTKVLLRYELLEELYRRGLNRHRAVRASSDFSSLRFPVFVREEFRHTGAISPLLYTRRELEAALGRVLLRGFRLDGLLVVEFCDTRDSQGRYRKYTAYVVRSEVMPRSLEVGSAWMLKHGAADFNEQTLLAEREYVLTSPHEAQLREIFALAGIEYGRIDYAIKDGTIETWEINTNPSVGPGTRTVVPGAMQSVRQPTRDEFNRRFQAAIEALDVVPADGTIAVRHGGHEPGVALVRELRKPDQRLALLKRLGPLRGLFETAARMLAPWVARAARRRR